MAQRQFRSDDTSSWSEGYGNGSDGAKTVSSNETYDGARASCSGTAAATALTLGAASTFANGDAVIIHQVRGTGAGAWELNKVASGGGTTSITLSYAMCNTYTDSGASQAQVVELKQYSAVTVNGSQTWSAPDWDGDTGGLLAFLCTGTTTVTGSLGLSGKGFRGGANDPGGDPRDGYQGESSTATGTQTTAANGMGGGGAAKRAGDDGGGGGGGYATSGSVGEEGPNSTGGAGGGTGGTASLTTLFFGGAGGGTGGTGTAGADSGGVCLIISKIITVTGSVAVNGNSISSVDMTGGGGAGGSCLFKGQQITLGTNLVTASGGTSDSSGTTDGGDGGVGRIHADYATSLSGTTSPTLDSTQDATLADLASTPSGSFAFL